MSRSFLSLGLIPLALAVVSADAARRTEDLVREGNAAYARTDYEQALKLYKEAEDRAPDPGLLAFNEGAALFRAGRYREAELHYRRALEGASGARQARALYDLGNCLLREAADNDVKGLAEAMNHYEECLVHPQAGMELSANAARNLELARLLWHQARQRAQDEAPKDPDSADNTASGAAKDSRKPAVDPGASEAQPDGKDRAPAQADQEGNQKAIESGQETPGKGNLPPLPDRDELAPLAPEDAAAYLDRAARRIVRERREYRQGAPPVAPNVKDW